jgi:hypothetical protein
METGNGNLLLHLPHSYEVSVVQYNNATRGLIQYFRARISPVRDIEQPRGFNAEILMSKILCNNLFTGRTEMILLFKSVYKFFQHFTKRSGHYAMY